MVTGVVTVLEVRGLRVELGGATVVDDVDLRLAEGEVLGVLGPSGCGKSTLLRAVAGLEPPAAGAVLWDGVDLATTPTHRRGFALMFQDGQLFDHLTVGRNVAYAPRLRGVGRRAAAAEVADLLELVGLGGYADRLPRTLSGGERQRVALARSLAACPRLLLLDEPLSALDADLRVRLADDLRRILTEARTTALLVTHDHGEAFAVADRLALMRAGRIVQQGPTAEVWAAPVDAATARFLGYPVVLDGDAAARLLALAGRSERPVGATQVALRAGAVVAGPAAGIGGVGKGVGRVVTVRADPDGVRLEVDVDGVGVLPARAEAGWSPALGASVTIAVPAGLAVLPDRR